MKSLAKDTAIYGVSSIVGKFLNWLLVPLYTYTLERQADYGIVTNLYAWTALLLVILTYGMETGYFRFANKNVENSDKVYGNSLISVGFTSLLFAFFIVLFHQPIANLLGYANHSEFIWMLGLTVAMDAFASIPFAYLRFKQRPIVFATMKLLYIALNIVLNLFFLVLCPWLMKVAPDSISWFYDPHYGVGYIFISNLIATTIQTLVLAKYIFAAKFEFDSALLKQIFRYSFPLLFLGIAGIANQNLDKILFPFLQLGESGKADLGIYGAVSKIAMVIMMFTQAFRYAYEPFVFARQTQRQEQPANLFRCHEIFRYILAADFPWNGPLHGFNQIYYQAYLLGRTCRGSDYSLVIYFSGGLFQSFHLVQAERQKSLWCLVCCHWDSNYFCWKYNIRSEIQLLGFCLERICRIFCGNAAFVFLWTKAYAD